MKGTSNKGELLTESTSGEKASLYIPFHISQHLIFKSVCVQAVESTQMCQDGIDMLKAAPLGMKEVTQN